MNPRFPLQELTIAGTDKNENFTDGYYQSSYSLN